MSTVHVVPLRGCGTRPLAHYLKALGLFRLVAEQRDPSARAFWKDDVFHLASTLDAAALVTFVADEYAPTPMVSPWNGGSGFYSEGNAARRALDALAVSTAARLERLRIAIRECFRLVSALSEKPAGDDKERLLAACSREWSEDSSAWLSATVALGREGEGRYPAILGTGGNDGNFEFGNNAIQRILELIDPASGIGTPEARSAARSALLGETDRGHISAAIGQFLPGGAGGANAAAGFDGGALFNPWDFVLALEGTVLLRVASLRRLDGSQLPLAGAPFAFHGLAGGYGSAADADASDGRGEQWMPLWSAPATLSELRALFAEGRLVAGTDRPRGALDAARAVAQLGTARGVTAFERYGFMVRNGLSNLAVPMNRLQTRETPLATVRLLDELDGWLRAFRAASDDDHAPPSFGRAWRRLRGELFDLCIATEPGPRHWCAVLEALGAAEDVAVRSSRFAAARKLRPLPPLSARWLDAADDGSPEFRLASVLAGARAPLRRGRADALGPIRAHVLPLQGPTFERFEASEETLRDDPRVVWTGSELVANLARVVVRRAMESQREGFDGLALGGSRFAELSDIASFLTGALEDDRLGRLARGLMSVERTEEREPRVTRALPIYALFRVTNLDASEPTRRAAPEGAVRCDPQTLRLLAAGRLQDATQLAVRRLGAVGLRTKVRHGAGDPGLAARLLASLAFPVGPGAVRAAFDVITKPRDPHATETP